MALRLAELHGAEKYVFVCTPTGDELPDMVAHWERLECLLGRPILRLEHKLGLSGLIEKQAMIPNHRMRWCTRMLKIQPAILWMKEQGKCVSYVGLRADEEARKGGIFGEDVEQVFPLRDWGWGLAEVQGYLKEKGIKIPRRTDCGLCIFQTIGEWYQLWRDFPNHWAEGERLEEATGHTFRAPGRDTWPQSMAGLREAFTGGRIPKKLIVTLNMFEEEEAEQPCRACRL
jgi:3'-phosphoadenosine 5'-phosphosulfate sulfotransferase (PAPS reductase)/FAD synthetase